MENVLVGLEGSTDLRTTRRWAVAMSGHVCRSQAAATAQGCVGAPHRCDPVGGSGSPARTAPGQTSSVEGQLRHRLTEVLASPPTPVPACSSSLPRARALASLLSGCVAASLAQHRELPVMIVPQARRCREDQGPRLGHPGTARALATHLLFPANSPPINQVW